jgi:hypothetical protein
VNLGSLKDYNAKPCLTRPQHRFFKGKRYFEADVDVHLFNYLALRGYRS